jgi:hypothetical protein
MRRFYIAAGDLPAAMSDERRLELVRRLRNQASRLRNQGMSDEDIGKQITTLYHYELDELIRGHMRLALHIAGVFSAKYPRMDPQINLSVAYETLVDAVNNFTEKSYDDNLNYYIAGAIWSELRDSVDRILDVRMPVRTLRKIIRNGLNPSNELIEEANDLSEEKKAELRRVDRLHQYDLLKKAETLDILSLHIEVNNLIRRQVAVPHKHEVASDIDETKSLMDQIRESIYTPVARQEEIGIELREILDKIAYTPMETAILNLRKQGYNIEEISAKVGYCKSKVGNILQEIESRFENVWH